MSEQVSPALGDSGSSRGAASGAPAAGGKGPVGQGDYELRQGECILSVAFDHGHFWETIWNDPANGALREARGEPQKVLPGDRVTIMPLREGQASCSTEQRHRFRRRGVPAQLKLRFMVEEESEQESAGGGEAPDPDALHTQSEDPAPPEPPTREPRANVPYRLEIDGETSEGQTDDNGEVTISIPPNARHGEIVLEPDTERETVLPLKLGHLDPVTEDSGVAQRLQNLGYPASEDPEELAGALEAFQVASGLDATGELNDATRSALVDAHGE